MRLKTHRNNWKKSHNKEKEKKPWFVLNSLRSRQRERVSEWESLYYMKNAPLLWHSTRIDIKMAIGMSLSRALAFYFFSLLQLRVEFNLFPSHSLGFLMPVCLFAYSLSLSLSIPHFLSMSENIIVYVNDFDVKSVFFWNPRDELFFTKKIVTKNCNYIN